MLSTLHMENIVLPARIQQPATAGSCDYFLLRLLIICARDNRFEELAPSFTCMASAYLTHTGKSTLKAINLLLTVTCTEQVPPPSPRFSNVA